MNSRTATWVGASLLAVVVALSAGRLARCVFVPGEVRIEHWGLQDFRDAIYYPTVAFLDGRNPYDSPAYRQSYPVLQTFPPYAPSTFLLHLPFALLPPGPAGALYAAVTVGLTLAVAFLALRFVAPSPRAGAAMGLAAALLLSRPGHWNFMLGQYAATLVLGVYLALLYARPRSWLAGLGLALTTIKPTFGVPLAVLMLARGDWLAVGRGLVIAGLVAAGGLIGPVMAAGGLGAFVAVLPANLSAFENEPHAHALLSVYRADAIRLIARLIDRVPTTAEELAITGALLAVAALLVRRLAAAEAADDARPLSASLICVAMVACTYHLVYDLLLLTLPAVVVFAGWRAPPLPERPWLRWVSAAALAGLAGNYLTSENAVARLAITGRWWTTVAVLNGIGVVVVLARFGALAAARRRQWPLRSPLAVGRDGRRDVEDAASSTTGALQPIELP
jgi:hypothetical protein